MTLQSYFYKFIEPVSKELAYVARELENSVFTGHRTMLTHAITFANGILENVMDQEKIHVQQHQSLKERIDILDENGLLTKEICDALHYVRISGNQAAHQVRPFRYSEALLSWEAIYTIVKWYVEVYGPFQMVVPEYQDPALNQKEPYDTVELEARLENLEALLTASVNQPKDEESHEEIAATIPTIISMDEPPGFTTIRKITYKDRELAIPYYLRDAFLLPQRFAKSETFLIRLGAEQQARIMSELPNNLEGLHRHVKRYNVGNDDTFFNELAVYIEEENARRRLALAHPGELFLFYKAEHIVVTEELSRIPLDRDNFERIPSLLRQLNEDQIETVGQLPRELVILAKYDNVGIGTVENLFEQLRGKQEDRTKGKQKKLLNMYI